MEGTYVVQLSIGVLLEGAADLCHRLHADDAFDGQVRQVGAVLAVRGNSVRLDELPRNDTQRLKRTVGRTGWTALGCC